MAALKRRAPSRSVLDRSFFDASFRRSIDQLSRRSRSTGGVTVTLRAAGYKTGSITIHAPASGTWYQETGLISTVQLQRAPDFVPQPKCDSPNAVINNTDFRGGCPNTDSGVDANVTEDAHR